jgi:hypothetical protein
MSVHAPGGEAQLGLHASSAQHQKSRGLFCEASRARRVIQGVYYGVFPGAGVDDWGEPSSVWVVSRPHNWRPSNQSEHILELGLVAGEPWNFD